MFCVQSNDERWIGSAVKSAILVLDELDFVEHLVGEAFMFAAALLFGLISVAFISYKRRIVYNMI